MADANLMDLVAASAEVITATVLALRADSPRPAGTPLHNYASYLGVADLAAAAVRAGRRVEGSDVVEHALSRLDGRASARLEQLIARVRGILAGPDATEAHFDKPLPDPGGDQWPFERAQLRLD